MSNWFARGFGSVVSEARDAIAQTRHELMAGWFGRNFEPHPMRPMADPQERPVPGECDIHGNELGIDR